MKTWTITYEGNLKSRGTKGGTSFNGTVDVRAVSIEEALEKFYAIFNKNDPNRSFFLTITNIAS